MFIYLLVCEQTTFIYKGHCFSSCPSGTFMLPEKPNTKVRTDITSTVPRERAIIQNIPQKQCDSCHESCSRCRGPLVHECEECAPDLVYRKAAPNETYCDSSDYESGSPKIVKLVHNDHTSNDTVNNLSHKSIFKIFFDHVSIYMIFIYVVSVATILIAACLLCKSFSEKTAKNIGNDKKNYAYNRIDCDGTNDHITLDQEIIINTSDSSEENEAMK